MARTRKGTKDPSLRDILDKATLIGMAGERSFGRGQEYFKERRVGPLISIKDGVSSNVRGTNKYKVRLRSRAGGLDHSCSCPAAADGSFCKHCVAVGLAVLSGRAKVKETAISTEDVRAVLAGKRKDELVSMIMEYAADDERLWGRLHMDIARQTPGGPDLAAFRQMLDIATENEGFVDYNSSFGFARGIDEIVDRLDEILEQDSAAHARGVIELLEYAIGSVCEAMGSVDDSAGALGSVLDRLADLHLRACSKARPDPVMLAQRLFELELGSEYESYYGAVETYKHVLGKTGIAQYRKLADKLWKDVPQLRPGDDTRERYGSRSKITHMMLALARISGDLDELVSVLSRDLSYPYCFLEIATAYKDAGKHNEALEWAQRGIVSFPGHLDPRLVDFIAEEYDRQKSPGDAAETIWLGFMDRPSVDLYAKLKKYAIRAGEWDDWKGMALEHVRKLSREGASSRNGACPMYQTLLVEIFLWEKDIETA